MQEQEKLLTDTPIPPCVAFYKPFSTGVLRHPEYHFTYLPP
jgi:hypothetical protein